MSVTSNGNGDAPNDFRGQKPPRGRVLALDMARAMGVVAMVFGHSLDALLSQSARAQPAMVQYWKVRGLTAPLFMLVAGWTMALVMTGGSGPSRSKTKKYLWRVVTLFSLGYFLRFPGWDIHGLVAGDESCWQHFVAFDALHAIATGMLVVVLTLALCGRGRRSGLILASIAILLVIWGTYPRQISAQNPLAIALAQALGGTSPFPIFPWVAYLLCGAAFWMLASHNPARRTAWLAALGVALVAATCWRGVGTMASTNPTLIAFRAGMVFLLLAALEFCPARIAAAVAPIGQASLGIYVIHIPIVYGWSSLQGLAQRVGPSLSVHMAVLAALATLGCSFLAQRLWKGIWGKIVANVRQGARALLSAKGETLDFDEGT